jgi:thiol-disulfide isomerase/thioredoxin
VSGWKRSAGSLLILAVALAACTGPGSTASRGIAEGNLARDFTLQAIDGHKVSLSDYQGSVVLLNFWATWCPPCQAEIPALEAAYEVHEDEAFVILGVNVEESDTAVEPFVQSLGMTYPILLDGSGKLFQEYRGQGLPMSILLDRDGTIRVRHVGYLSAQQLDKYLADVLP